MRRRDFIAGSAALAAYAQVRGAEALVGSRRVLFGVAPERISVDGVLYERLRSADSSYLYDSLNQPLYGRVP